MGLYWAALGAALSIAEVVSGRIRAVLGGPRAVLGSIGAAEQLPRSIGAVVGRSELR